MPKKKLTILCAGGKVIEEPDSLRKLIRDFVAITGRKILVHGGGDMTQRVAAKMGVKVQNTRDGRPIVGEQLLHVMAMVHGGLIDTRLVTLLQWHGVKALGLTGADMNLLLAAKRAADGVDCGETGEICKVNAPALQMLLDADVTPVVAPLAHDGNSHLLSVDPDDVAAELGRALATSHDITLIYCTDRNGVLMNEHDPDSVIAALKRTQYRNLKEMGIIKGGMLPKIDSAFSSIDHGVKHVIITSVARLHNREQGTHIK